MEKANKKLQDLIALWQEKRGGKALPSRGDLPVSILRPWLGNLALIDLTGDAPYFRLCGTSLHARFGGEMTGQKLEAVTDAHSRQELVSCIEKAKCTLNPAPAVHQAGVGRNRTIFHELCLPLGYDGKTADTMLLACYAERKDS
jgi:hypothetical protein